MTKRDLINEILEKVEYSFNNYPDAKGEDMEGWTVVYEDDYVNDMELYLEEIFAKYDLYIKLKGE